MLLVDFILCYLKIYIMTSSGAVLGQHLTVVCKIFILMPNHSTISAINASTLFFQNNNKQQKHAPSRQRVSSLTWWDDVHMSPALRQSSSTEISFIWTWNWSWTTWINYSLQHIFRLSVILSDIMESVYGNMNCLYPQL